MANVLFKRGLQARLTTATTPINDGTFYLTTDTNRLYADVLGKRVLLNQTVQFVDSIDTLMAKSSSWSAAEKVDHVNDLYYITGGNILAVYTDTGIDGGWTQINPDHNTYVTSTSFIAAAGSGDTVNLTIDVIDNDSNGHTATLAVKGSDGISVGVDDGALEISGDPYNFNGNIASNTLNLVLNNSSTTQTVAIKAAGASHFTANGAELLISSDNTVNASASLSVDNGVLTVGVTDSDSNVVSATAALGIQLSDNTFMPIVATGGLTAATSAIYSRADIDQMFKGLNSMTYKGTVSDTLPTSNVSVGDVYMVAQNGAASAVHAGAIVGDLFIATLAEGASEDASGYIPSGSIEWTYVPSGNDSLAEVSYTSVVTTATNQLILEDGNNITKAGIVLSAGTDMSLLSGSSTSGVLSTTISHATISTTTNAAASLSDGSATFTAIKGLTISNGHVTAIETDTFTPVTYNLTGATTTATDNRATVEIGLMDSNDIAQASANFTLESNTLAVSATGNNGVAVDLIWGTF